MKAITEMRNKYWSEEKSLVPATTSHNQLAVRYDYSQHKVDAFYMAMARVAFTNARNFLRLGRPDMAEKECNVANAHLVSALQMDGCNEAFWGKF